MRANVVAELPKIEWMSNSSLRQKVTDAWAAALAASPFSLISEMKPSGNFNTRRLSLIGSAHWPLSLDVGL
jgi:hypothetical protein